MFSGEEAKHRVLNSETTKRLSETPERVANFNDRFVKELKQEWKEAREKTKINEKE